MVFRTTLTLLLFAASLPSCIIVDKGDDDGGSSMSGSGSTSTGSTSAGATSEGSMSASSGSTSAGSTSAGSTSASSEATTAESSSSSSSDTSGGSTGDTSGDEPGFDPSSDAVQICEEGFADDPVEIEVSGVKGDVLFLTVGYSGGCATHEFGLCWDGAFAESEPVQVWLKLGHDAKGDACEAYITEPMQLDLSPLKEAWIAAYKQDHGTINVHLAGWDAVIPYIF